MRQKSIFIIVCLGIICTTAIAVVQQLTKEEKVVDYWTPTCDDGCVILTVDDDRRWMRYEDWMAEKGDMAKRLGWMYRCFCGEEKQMVDKLIGQPFRKLHEMLGMD